MNAWKSNTTRMSEGQLRNGKRMDGVYIPIKQQELLVWQLPSSTIICYLKKASKQDKLIGQLKPLQNLQVFQSEHSS